MREPLSQLVISQLFSRGAPPAPTRFCAPSIPCTLAAAVAAARQRPTPESADPRRVDITPPQNGVPRTSPLCPLIAPPPNSAAIPEPQYNNGFAPLYDRSPKTAGISLPEGGGAGSRRAERQASVLLWPRPRAPAPAPFRPPLPEHTTPPPPPPPPKTPPGFARAPSPANILASTQTTNDETLAPTSLRSSRRPSRPVNPPKLPPPFSCLFFVDSARAHMCHRAVSKTRVNTFLPLAPFAPDPYEITTRLARPSAHYMAPS